ncbi:MAG: efflux RND transporter periplasmic adaptor subunit [Gammaproteobacteria bacterium]|nr:efflux RND transporter periplasmic adaptor subunit [Gammaproteobacteria bacterium]
MTDSTPVALNQCVNLLNFEQEVRQARTEIELSFLMVNRSGMFLPADFVVYWQRTPSGKINIIRVSNLSEVNSNHTPLLQKFEYLIKEILANKEQSVRPLSEQDTASLELGQFFNWSCAAVLWCPLKLLDDKSRSGLIFIREKAWNSENILLANRLSEMYGFAYSAISCYGLDEPGLKKLLRKPLLLILAIFFALFIPVPQSVIAPATIIALQPDIVTAPLDGVIDKVLVKPNEAVNREQILFQFEQSSFRNRYEVAGKVLKVAQAKYLKAQQLSFSNNEMKAQLALLKAQMDQRSAEVDYAQQLLQRTVVHAAQNGIAIVDNINDLVGKPVQIGEKIMIIANPQQVEIEIELPIEDAIIMEPGALVELFLNNAPAKALSAELYYIGYSAQITRQGILAYRLLARFKQSATRKTPLPRIGLKGSAKIHGPQVSLFYYLFRRPLSVLRQTLGF